MRRVILFNMATLDGFFEGPNREIDWHNVDEEFNEFALEQLDSVGAILFGRVTYELMAAYWPTPAALKNDPLVAEKMNNFPKIVFSRTLQRAGWSNTRLIKGDVAKETALLKRQAGKDLVIFGSADMASSLTNLGLIDEYRVMLNPVVLGNGHPLFKGVRDRLNLQLLKTRPFRSGNVLLYYQPVT